MSTNAIRDFLAGDSFAVVGASADRSKYGNKVLRCLRQAGYQAFAVNPRGGDVEGSPSYANLTALPQPVHGVSIIVPPAVTRTVVEEAARLGIQHVWMQPGAESDEAIQAAERLGLHVIAGGPCILVAVGFRES